MGRLAEPEFARRLAVLPTELVASVIGVRGLQPVAGRWEIDGDSICFTPRFPFRAGTSYSLLVAGPSGADEEVESWPIQRPARAGAPTTTVVAIHPTADELPVNQLKLYVHFSDPMSEGWADRAVQVRPAADAASPDPAPLDGVFLPAGPELWDREHRRLTLLLDPGRIKRGLAPHEHAGYPLVDGVPIVVAVDPAFRDAEGRPLRTGAERRYRVGPPVRARIVPAEWELIRPAAGSTQPLTVWFDRPLDHALLEHGLHVTNAAGHPIPGAASIGPGEQSWRFTPGSPWQAGGRYTVTIDPRLEDLAGNSLTRVFDRDLTQAADAPLTSPSVTLAFTCAPASR